LIEKPARGDFLPILDGGFGLQYAPLLECREGNGLLVFCQMDVTGRSEDDPAAQKLVANILRYVATWKPEPSRAATYAGEPDGLKHLQSLGLDVRAYAGGELAPEQILIQGPGASRVAHPTAADVGNFLAARGRLVAVGLDQQEADATLPFKITLTKAEHIGAPFDPPMMRAPFVGIGPADVHNRGPRELPLLTGGAKTLGDGVLGNLLDAKGQSSSVCFCQFAPWQIERQQPPNLKRTFRRTSFLLTRLLANCGVRGATPLLDRFHTPVKVGRPEQRWANGLYLDAPQEWDDPYRFFRW
jgi:hypothetical protein